MIDRDSKYIPMVVSTFSVWAVRQLIAFRVNCFVLCARKKLRGAVHKTFITCLRRATSELESQVILTPVINDNDFSQRSNEFLLLFKLR